MELKKEKGPVEYNKRGSLQFSQCNEPFYCNFILFYCPLDGEHTIQTPRRIFLLSETNII